MALGNIIDQVNSEKLLGVTIDSKLLFDEHIDELCQKVAQKIGALKNIRKNLPIAERKLFFNSMIKPVMLCGSTVWDSCSRENINKIYKLPKRTARVILESDKNESSNSLFIQLNWLTITDEIEIRKCCLIYKRINGLIPDYIEDILVRNSDVHLRTTRHCNVNLVFPRFKRESQVTKRKL